MPSSICVYRKAEGKAEEGFGVFPIKRHSDLKDAVCQFFITYRVSFNNQQAERDLRDCKTKCKVSGCFRSEEGAQDYLSIFSYISTGRKQGRSAFDALTAAINGMANIVIEKFIPTETKVD